MQINVVFENCDNYTSDDKIKLWNDICSLFDFDCHDLTVTFSDVCSDMRK